MKTTVKLDNLKDVVIEPQGSGVRLTIRMSRIPLGDLTLTADQVGAVLFGMEQAAEAAQIEQQARAA
ncbi:hypothetical protein [uncultured Pseudacidovorax sp.]|uniref:hypothetical protein n=1 Tax=uncultured Pseudacidovorax sp. TaxID=679313 RepID=UPI0025ED6DF5|nr:hypothetical protein [uncultured Pseudacidovorax sp.]